MVNAIKIPIRGLQHCNVSEVLLGKLVCFQILRTTQKWRRLIWNKIKPPYEEKNLEPLTQSVKEGTIDKVVGVTFVEEKYACIAL